MSSPPCRGNLRRLPSGLVAALCAMLLLGLLGGCGRAPDTTLRIAISPWPGYGFAFLARDLGYFAAEGLDVRLLQFHSLADSRRAFERGQVDGFFGTPVELLLAQANSRRRVRAALVTNFSQGGDVVLAAPAVRRVGDLKGLRIGLEMDSVNLFVLVQTLAEAGLGIDDVKPVPTPQNHLQDALRDGLIDAAVSYPPHSDHIVRAGLARVLVDSASMGPPIPDALVLDGTPGAVPQEKIARFAAAYWRAAAYAQVNAADASRRMAAHLGLSADALDASLRGGIDMLGEADQAAALAPGGPFDRSLYAIAAALRISRTLNPLPPVAAAADILRTPRVAARQ